MAKRTATTELTDRNWDQEEDPEEAGEFQKASVDAMKGRQILKARRRQPGDEEKNKTTAFTGFGGFSFKPSQTSTPLLGSGFKAESKLVQGSTEKSGEDEKMKDAEYKDKKTVQEQNGSESRTSYLTNLKALNQSVTQWISQHVEKNPYCLLTPIFKDYEKHLAELEKEKDKPVTNGSADSSSKTDIPKPPEEVKALPKTGLTFGMGLLKTETTLGNSAVSASKPAFAGFGFGNTAASSGAGSGFSFAVGSSKPETSTGAEGDAAEEEEHVPPVVQSVEHKEEGSLYNKKCKLYYQKDGAWVERGVGFLHLKNPEGKAQLLVRADTTLGNILLNIRLSESIPLSRQGKNSVTMMCVVNPEIPKVPTDKPIPMLIRVKTTEDADELLEKMKEVQN